MSKDAFINSRNYTHTYSRSPLAEGQFNIDQATVRSGHTVSFDEVRAEEIPSIPSIENRDAFYIAIDEITGKRVVGGSKGIQYVSVLKFIDGAQISEIAGSNGESFSVVDENDNEIIHWIDPTDKPTSQTSLSDGYEIRVFVEMGMAHQKIELSKNFGWDFDQFNGILHFSSKFKPGSAAWNEYEFSNPTVEGFIYTGKYVSDLTSNIQTAFGESIQSINEELETALMIQPYMFSTSKMTTIGAPYQKADTDPVPEKCDWFMTYTFIIPGYVFEVTTVDNEETIMTEMRHLPNGNTQIFIDIPYDINYRLPILKFAYDTGLEGVGNRYPVVGHWKFSAIAFVQRNGTPIPVNEPLDYDAHPNMVISPAANEFPFKNAIDNGTVSPYQTGIYVGVTQQ